MPVSVTKHGRCYRVSTPGGVKAKCTTAAKAKKQKRLLYAIDHGWKPTGRKSESLVDQQASQLVNEVLKQARAKSSSL